MLKKIVLSKFGYQKDIVYRKEEKLKTGALVFRENFLAHPLLASTNFIKYQNILKNKHYIITLEFQDTKK